MTQRFSCARAALTRDEPRYGTASQVTRWLLLEEPGPWGADAVIDSRLDPAVARALQLRAASLSARLLLIRRHRAAATTGRRLVAAVSAVHGSWAEAFELDSAADVLDLPLEPLGDHRRVGGTPLAQPLHLVCTNGSHDACCAEFGRPLAGAVTEAVPERAWECSHIGGDRFAGNLLCLPEGVYYGHVGLLDAARVVAAHDAGRLDLAHYRGRSCLPFVAQAADYFVRREHGLTGIDQVRYTGRSRRPDGCWDVWFATAPERRVRCRVAVVPDAEPRPLTCHSGRRSHPPRYRLEAMETTAPPG